MSKKLTFSSSKTTGSWAPPAFLADLPWGFVQTMGGWAPLRCQGPGDAKSQLSSLNLITCHWRSHYKRHTFVKLSARHCAETETQNSSPSPAVTMAPCILGTNIPLQSQPDTEPSLLPASPARWDANPPTASREFYLSIVRTCLPCISLPFSIPGSGQEGEHLPGWKSQQSHPNDRLQGWWWDEPTQVTARLDQSKPLDERLLTCGPDTWVGFALEWVVADVWHVPFCVINPISVSLSRMWEGISVEWYHRQMLYSTHVWAFVCCKLTWHGYVWVHCVIKRSYK